MTILMMLHLLSYQQSPLHLHCSYLQFISCNSHHFLTANPTLGPTGLLDFIRSWTHGRDTSQTWNFSKEERKDPSRYQGCQKVGFEPATLGSIVQRSNHSANQLQLPNRRKIFAIYAPTLLMYIVANPKSAILR